MCSHFAYHKCVPFSTLSSEESMLVQGRPYLVSLIWSNYFSRGKDDVPPVTLSWSRCTPGPELRDCRLVQPRHRASFQLRSFRCSSGQMCSMGCRSGGRSGTSGPISCPQRRSSSPSLGRTQLAGSQQAPQLVCLVALGTVGLKKVFIYKD